MYKIYIVYDKDDQIELFKSKTFKESFLVEYYNMNSMKERKLGFKLKDSWGAISNPFCIIFDGDKPIKAFYSENKWEENAIVQLINYLENDFSNT